MPIGAAKTLLPDGVIAAWDPYGDFRAALRLAERALRFTPLAALDPLWMDARRRQGLAEASPLCQGLVLDLAGTDRLYRGFSPPEEILKRLAAAGITAKIGAADTVGAAWALSRWGRLHFNSAGRTDLAASLAALPVEALRIPRADAALLRESGITRISHLLAVPAKMLRRRFSPKVPERIEQALGLRPEPLEFIRPCPAPIEQRAFETPLSDAGEIGRQAGLLFAKLLRRLDQDGRRADAFQIRIAVRRPCGRPFEIVKTLSFAAAAPRPAHILSRLEIWLESLDLPGAVDAIAVRAEPAPPPAAAQIGLNREPPREDPGECAETIDLLGARLGRRAILTVSFSDALLPEESFAYSPWQNKSPAAGRSAPLCFDRPPRLLQRPLSIEAMALLPDRPPVWIRIRRRVMPLARGLGPERIALPPDPDQPGSPPGERDYFQVQDLAGRWLWVFRDNRDQRWFIHGTWS